MSQLVRFGVSIEDSLLADFDRVIEEKGYASRSEAFRDLIRGYLVEADWTALRGEQAATLTLVYNHEYREITDRLTDLQHGYQDIVVCSTHVHLTHHTCLEAIVLRGEAAKIRTMADRLIATRGVKHGRVVSTSMGKELS